MDTQNTNGSGEEMMCACGQPPHKKHFTLEEWNESAKKLERDGCLDFSNVQAMMSCVDADARLDERKLTEDRLLAAAREVIDDKRSSNPRCKIAGCVVCENEIGIKHGMKFMLESLESVVGK